MKSMKRIVLLLSLALVAGTSLTAQEYRTSYFYRDGIYGYKINPAIQPKENVKFFAGGIIGNASMTPQNEFPLSSLIYRHGNKYVNGLTSINVDKERFIEGLYETTRGELRLDESVFSLGFRDRAHTGWFTVELNARSNSTASVPKTLLSFIKMGTESTAFESENIYAKTRNYLELAVGYNKQIGDVVTLGARIKILGGLGAADMKIDYMGALRYGSGVLLNSSGTFTAAQSFVDIGTKYIDGIDFYDFSKTRFNKFGFSGFGVAVDLGIHVEVTDGLVADFGVQDLGSTTWFVNDYGIMKSSSSGDPIIIPIEDMVSPETIYNGMLSFKKKDPEKPKFYEALPVTFSLGGKYNFPTFKKATVGILGTFRTRGSGFENAFDIRLGGSYSPFRWMEISTNAGFTKLGAHWGLGFNFNAGPVNVFFGTDSVVLSYKEAWIPNKPFRSTVNAGVTFVLRNKN